MLIDDFLCISRWDGQIEPIFLKMHSWDLSLKLLKNLALLKIPADEIPTQFLLCKNISGFALKDGCWCWKINLWGLEPQLIKLEFIYQNLRCEGGMMEKPGISTWEWRRDLLLSGHFSAKLVSAVLVGLKLSRAVLFLVSCWWVVGFFSSLLACAEPPPPLGGGILGVVVWVFFVFYAPAVS